MPAESPKATAPKSFRLEPATIADLDLIAEHYTAGLGVPYSRTDALRLAARIEAENIRRAKKTKKKS